MITTDQRPTIVKCDKCGKKFIIEPFSMYAPMCHKCHKIQTLCDQCAEKGCMVCGAPLPLVMH